MKNKETSSKQQFNELIMKLEERFRKNKIQRNDVEWAEIQARLEHPDSQEKLWSLNEMERTGGEPDFIRWSSNKSECIFYDCSTESPAGRRSFCYDKQGLESRKKHKPRNSAVDMAAEMGVELLNEEQYRELQEIGDFDTKTSSWIKTPEAVRKLGGALFADFRYGQVFIYHNSAPSYYASRGFRGVLRI